MQFRVGLVSLLFFVIAAVATWFVTPAQPQRVLTASAATDRRFVALLPGTRWAVTARVEWTDSGPMRRVAPIRLYDLEAGKESFELIASGELMNFRVGLSPDETLLAISIGDGVATLEVWDLKSGKHLASLPQLCSGWAGRMPDRARWWFSADSRHLAYESLAALENRETATLHVWHRADNQDGPLAPHSDRAAFSPDSRRIAAVVFAAADGKMSPAHVGIFDLTTGEETARLPLEEFQEMILCLAWTPDCRRIAVADRAEAPETTRIIAWNLNDGTTEPLLPPNAFAKEVLLRQFHEMRFSPDGRYLWMSGVPWNSVPTIWDLSTEPPERMGYSHDTDRRLMDRPFAVAGKGPTTQRLWRPGSEIEQAPVLVESQLVIHSVSINPPDELASIAHFNGKSTILDFWETKTGRKVSTFADKAFVGFSANGARFYTLPPFDPTPGEQEVLGEMQARTMEEWDVVPGPPWRWLSLLWTVEGVVAMLAARLLLRKKSPTEL